jgi:hypothetical protein
MPIQTVGPGVEMPRACRKHPIAAFVAPKSGVAAVERLIDSNHTALNSGRIWVCHWVPAV